MKPVLIRFFDIADMMHAEFIPEGQALNQAHDVEVRKHLGGFVLHRRNKTRPLAQAHLSGGRRRRSNASLVPLMWPILAPNPFHTSLYYILVQRYGMVLASLFYRNRK